jgi:hypothetical protein
LDTHNALATIALDEFADVVVMPKFSHYRLVILASCVSTL